MTLRVVRMIEERFHRDVEGRPIREGRTPPEFLREGDIEYKTCPYSGSRLGKPMNASALRQAGVHWDEVLDALAWLRSAHDHALGVTTPTIWDIWRTSQLGSALPWFFILRDEPVPGYAAALSKMTLGMGIWAQRMFVKSLTDGWTPGHLTPEHILELAEGSGTLVGDSEVCSGGDKMLLRYFEVHVGAPSPGKLAAPHAEFLQFGAHYTSFKLVVWIYYLARRFLYADANTTQLDTSVEPSDFFIVEPGNLRDVIPQQRLGWFRSLANLVTPFSPDRGDLALRDAAFAIAAAMGKGASPATTWAELDAIFGRVIATTEAGLGGSPPAEVPAAIRDRLIGASPRAFFTNAAGT
jgi:hypothetical protein